MIHVPNQHTPHPTLPKPSCGGAERMNVAYVKVKEVSNIISGYAFKSNMFNNEQKGMPIIRIRDISKDYSKTYTEESYREEFIVRKGDFLIGMDGEFNLFKWSGPDALLNQRVCKIIPNKKVNSKYLLYFLPKELKIIEDVTPFVTVKHLSVKKIQQIKIPLPPLAIQQKIAEALDKADAIRRRNKQMLEKYDQLIYSQYLNWFGKENFLFDHWKEVEIKNLAENKKGSMRTGPFGSDLLHSEFVDEGIAVLGIDNAVENTFNWKGRRFITLEKFEKLKRYRVFPNDVIITIMGTTGRSAVIPENIPLAINTKHLAAITLNKKIANPYFVAYSIHSNPYILEQIKQRTRGAIMDGLNLTIIKELKVKLPPIELQNHFAKTIEEIEVLKIKVQQERTASENLFQSLLQKAFKGELFEQTTVAHEI